MRQAVELLLWFLLLLLQQQSRDRTASAIAAQTCKPRDLASRLTSQARCLSLCDRLHTCFFHIHLSMTHAPLSTSTFIIQEAAIPRSVIQGKKQNTKIHAPGSPKSKNRILNQMTAKLECDEKTCEAEFGLSVAFSHGFCFLPVMSKAEFTLDGAHCIVGCFLWVHLLWALLLPRCLH